MNLDGAVIDSSVIGGTTPAAGSFTTLSASTSITGTLTGNVTGNLTGNVTGDVTGDLTGTVLTAAQPNITSLGTLTGLNVSGTPTFDGLTVDGTATFNTGTGTTNNFIITGTDAGGSTAPDLVLFRDSASPVDGDNIGMLLFKGNNDAGTAVGYAGIFATINDASSTTEDGKLNFSVATANTESPSGGTTFMTIEGGGDIYFYEDTGTTAKLFWDASAESLGIGTTSPSSELHVIGETRVEQTGAASRLVINRYDANAADSSTIDLLESSSQGASFGTTAVFGYRLELDGNTNNLNIKSGNQSTVNTRLSIERDTGNFGIGTDSPDGKLHIESSSSGATAGAGGDELILESSATTGLSILSGTANDGNILFGDSGNSAIGYVQYKHADNALNFGVNGGTKATIDSSGNVGIGATSPNYPLTVHRTGDGIKFEISDLVDANYRIQVSGNDIITGPSTGSDYIFQTSNIERARIDTSGNFLVGKISADNGATVGLEYTAADKLYVTDSASSAIVMNRLASDGNIAVFQKDGSPVGSIGVAASDNIYFAGDSGSTKGIYINEAALYPADTGGAVIDNAVALGQSSVRWTDLYLSGGAYLGGTAAANKLDDYEEGTWTPVTNSGSWTVNTGTYTKVGNMVTCRFKITATATISANDFTGLPFTPASESAGVCGYQNSESGVVFSIAVQSSNVWNFRVASAQKGVANGALVYGIFTYHTTA